MRFLFCSVSAHGHVLPLVPLMEAARSEGHDVALIGSGGMADVVRAELPLGVEYLPAGPMPFELAVEAARRTGGDVMAPSAEGVGEIFGGIVLERAADDAVAAARSWQADVVISEVYCTVGPFVAAVLGLTWHEVRMTTAMPAEWVQAIDRATARHYDERGLSPVAASSVLDLWPAKLRDPVGDLPANVPVLPVRTRAHRRPRGAGPSRVPAFSDRLRPRVLVTLGTVFSDTELLDSVVDAVAGNDVDVLATLGLSLQGGAGVGRDREGAGGGSVKFVSFVPIDELLDEVDLVVGVGGAGTTLAALSRGIPLVLWPQGADQPAIAERVSAAGAALTVGALSEIGPAVAEALTATTYWKSAGDVAQSIADTPAPPEVIRLLASGAQR